MKPDTTHPSRELDYFVAERIANWEWWKSSSSGRRALFAPGVIPRSDREWFLERADGTESLVSDWDYCEKDIPAYSSNRAAAFELAWTFDEVRILKFTDMVFVYMKNGKAEGPVDDVALVICQAAIAATNLE